MHRGLEVGIFLRPDLAEPNFVAMALGNLAAFRLEAERNERLEWQVLRVQTSDQHHYRLVLRHPERVLDLGFKSHLETILKDLSNETLEELRARLRAAEQQGLKPVALRSIREPVDFWRDDFWNWFG
jgi:hypothetical protein